MNSLRGLVLGLILATLTSCRSTVDRIPSWSAKVEANKSLLAESTFYPVPEKQKFFNEIQAAHEQIFSKVEAKMAELSALADDRSDFILATGAVGIVAGVAASVLLVASPANAVWAAGFAGLGTGAIGFQTNLAAEGYTRAAVEVVYNAAMTRMDSAESAYQTAEKALKALIAIDDNTQWDTATGAASEALAKLRAALVFIPIAKGTENDIQALKTSNNAILTELAEIKKQLNDKKKPSDAPPSPTPAPKESPTPEPK